MKFGTRSKKQIATLDPRLVEILEIAIKETYIDFGIHEGARTVEMQQHYFDTGKSKIDPSKYSTPDKLAEDAKHIVTDNMPLSRAFDFHCSNGMTWDRVHLTYLAGFFMGIAAKLGYTLRWGGDFDQDGRISEKNSFVDLPHIEIVG